jgi:hypothetical protein
MLEDPERRPLMFLSYTFSIYPDNEEKIEDEM